MSVSRRDFAVATAATVLASTIAARATEETAKAPAAAAGDMPKGEMPEGWMGKEQIAFLIYPGMAALDMVGPHQMLSGLMGATVHVVAKSMDPVKANGELTFIPTATFETCPKDLDVLCVPGGDFGTIEAMKDDATLRFLKDRGSRARYVTSVCTGSLLLGAAGLLDGYEATSHWATISLLPIFGAKHRAGRTVVDRNRMTGGGVTAGIDLGLKIVGELRDRTYAEITQLMAEYSPEPPFDAGTPDRAPAEVTRVTRDMFPDFLKQAAEVGRASLERSRTL
ncbi:MAG: DJ-1/PfpI family protein [Leifsonia xyli]|nr:MAG: DJ-1/PfpI family protein [Leifsonia xyli]